MGEVEPPVSHTETQGYETVKYFPYSAYTVVYSTAESCTGKQFFVVPIVNSRRWCILIQSGGQIFSLLWPGFQILAGWLSDTPKALLT